MKSQRFQVQVTLYECGANEEAAFPMPEITTEEIGKIIAHHLYDNLPYFHSDDILIAVTPLKPSRAEE